MTEEEKLYVKPLYEQLHSNTDENENAPPQDSNSEQMTPEKHRKRLSDKHFEMFGKNLKCTEAYKANPMENSELFPSIIHNIYHFHGTNTAAGHKTLEITRYTNAKPDKQESKVLARLIKM